VYDKPPASSVERSGQETGQIFLDDDQVLLLSFGRPLLLRETVSLKPIPDGWSLKVVVVGFVIVDHDD
jgi:hypothetical protein